MRLRPWVKVFLSLLFILSFCFLCGIVEIEFSFTSIAMVLSALGIFGGSAYLISRFC